MSMMTSLGRDKRVERRKSVCSNARGQTGAVASGFGGNYRPARVFHGGAIVVSRQAVVKFPPSQVEVWGRSSAGRASRSQCEGREFDPPRLHQDSRRPLWGPFYFRDGADASGRMTAAR